MLARLNLPRRRGPKPETTHGLPHAQVTQHGPDDVVDQMHDWAFSLLGVDEAHSLVSVPGARALVMHDRVACNHNAFMIDREFAHFHPHPDNGSMHVQLPSEDALEIVEKNWGEHHTLVLKGHRAVGLVMVYSPRDETELTAIKSILGRSYEYATGHEVSA
ncbi:luciferase family protein [Labrenzia sp. DG1229]|uniref:luciferase domain-containing protein n=1 Tax=Labrenzia sp. DG1229 TaxID=681847 RepID=UPI000490D15F|nr:luciferase family protein [Labrenzia sp. DG1229]